MPWWSWLLTVLRIKVQILSRTLLTSELIFAHSLATAKLVFQLLGRYLSPVFMPAATTLRWDCSLPHFHLGQTCSPFLTLLVITFFQKAQQLPFLSGPPAVCSAEHINFLCSSISHYVGTIPIP